jgi:hypothetical protein
VTRSLKCKNDLGIFFSEAEAEIYCFFFNSLASPKPFSDLGAKPKQNFLRGRTADIPFGIPKIKKN